LKRLIAISLIFTTVLILGQLLHDRTEYQISQSPACPRRPEVSVASPRVVIINDECTGFILADGYVGTANHCMEPAEKNVLGDKQTVTFFDGSKEVFTLIAKGNADEKDYALLRGSTHGIAPSPVAMLSPAVDGVVRAVGYGGGDRGLNTLHMTVGAYEGEYEGYMKSAIVVLPGDSGGPLLDEEGNICGINVRTGYPIPIGLSVKAFYLVQAMVNYEKGNGSGR